MTTSSNAQMLWRTWERLRFARACLDATTRLQVCGPGDPPCPCRDRVNSARDLLATARDAWHVARGLEA